MSVRRPGLRQATSVFVLSAALLSASPARSQEPVSSGPLLVGSRVRLLAPGVTAGRVTGTVSALDEHTLTLTTDDHLPLQVTRLSITELETSAGRHRNVLKGTLIGAASGAAVFALVPRDEYCADLGPGESCPTKATIIGIGAFGGAAWGALIGHFVKSDRWTRVATERVQVGLGPAGRRGGLGLRLSVGW